MAYKKYILAMILIVLFCYTAISATVNVTTTENIQGGKIKNMKNPTIKITTTKGDILVELYPDVAPKTVENFFKLTKSGFYNGLIFHRVIPGFVVQGGDPQTKGEQGKDWTLDPKEFREKGIPMAGTGGPGYTIKAEFNERKHLAGTFSMARSAHPDSAGSQFYICLAPQPHLDNQYTVFGQVIEGMDNVLELEIGDKMEELIVLKDLSPEDLPKDTTENSKVEKSSK